VILRTARHLTLASALFVLAAAALLGPAAGAPRAGPANADPTSSTAAGRLLDRAGRSLLARRIRVPGRGWAWRSAIQAPHLQTDRDVGAASVILGLLSLYDVTHDRAYLTGARRAGNWLRAVAKHSRGGLAWPDYVDARTRASTDYFTSFDDGVPGIADALWRLGTVTGDRRYRVAALAGMRWEESVAQSPSRGRCPRTLCRWRYDLAGDDSTIRTGMGEGNAGIAYAFDVFSQRTGNRRFERYAIASASYLERLISPQGAMPWGPGRAHYIAGFLSGAAGDALMFLHLYEHTHDARWLGDAQRLLAYVRGREQRQAPGANWPIYDDPGQPGDPQGNLRATGIEEGAAGIGWVELQAWHLTRNPLDLATAVAAGDWLVSVAGNAAGGSYWTEDLGVPLTHTSLDNGAPGIGWFLHDLALDTGQARYEQEAERAVAWLGSVTRASRDGAYWEEHLGPHGWRIPADPSWHWGIAGIAGFLARMSGWTVDMPGEEPGLPETGWT
jgi:Lanthionine synthetase C-like protein